MRSHFDAMEIRVHDAPRRPMIVLGLDTCLNACQAAMDAGDVSQWFGSSILILSVTDGSSHTCTGVAPTKVPDKAYDKQAEKITWVLLACNIHNQ